MFSRISKIATAGALAASFIASAAPAEAGRFSWSTGAPWQPITGEYEPGYGHQVPPLPPTWPGYRPEPIEYAPPRPSIENVAVVDCDRSRYRVASTQWRDGSSDRYRVVLNCAATVSSAHSDAWSGFRIADSYGDVVRFRRAADAEGYTLAPGEYRFIPNLGHSMDVARLNVTLDLETAPVPTVADLLEGRWRTEAGPALFRTAGERFHGRLTDHGVKLVGRVTASGATGTWVQKGGEPLCESKKRGSRTWGRFRIRLDGDNEFVAETSACNDDFTGTIRGTKRGRSYVHLDNHNDDADGWIRMLSSVDGRRFR